MRLHDFATNRHESCGLVFGKGISRPDSTIASDDLVVSRFLGDQVQRFLQGLADGLRSQCLSGTLRQVIIDTLIILAVVEVFKTTLTYFSEGRVKVTFIVDTILVVMLTEVIAQWFKGESLTHLAVLGGILLTLGAMRVLAVRCSPVQGENSRAVV